MRDSDPSSGRYGGPYRSAVRRAHRRPRGDLIARADAGVDHILEALRAVIRASGCTQVEIQREVGWGRSYISQFLRRQKRLKMSDVLDLLAFAGIEPGWFFSKVYNFTWHGSEPPISLDLPSNWREKATSKGEAASLNSAPLARYLATKARYD